MKSSSRKDVSYVNASVIQSEQKWNPQTQTSQRMDYWSNSSTTMQYSSHTRGIKTSPSQKNILLLAHANIGSSSMIPAPPPPQLHNQMSFKRFKDKYFQQTNHKDKKDQLKPTFQQIPLTQLKKKRASILPLLTAEELKRFLNSSIPSTISSDKLEEQYQQQSYHHSSQAKTAMNGLKSLSDLSE